MTNQVKLNILFFLSSSKAGQRSQGTTQERFLLHGLFSNPHQMVTVVLLLVNRSFHWFSKSLDLEKQGNMQMQLNAKLSLFRLDYIK